MHLPCTRPGFRRFDRNPSLKREGDPKFTRRDDFMALASIMKNILNFGVFMIESSKSYHLGQIFGNRVDEDLDSKLDTGIVRCLEELRKKEREENEKAKREKKEEKKRRNL